MLLNFGRDLCAERRKSNSRLVLCLSVLAYVGADPFSDSSLTAGAWRLVNTDEVEVWRLRSLQFCEDLECMKPLLAEPNVTGIAFATAASDMTGPDHAFALRSMRGWETEDICDPRDCHIGFEWYNLKSPVRCVLLNQGETGLHADAMTLQRRPGPKDEWLDVAAWSAVDGGKAKLAVLCPPPPSIPRAEVHSCTRTDERSQECSVRCADGFGAVQPQMRCMNGAWFMPECLPIGSMMRVVAQSPAVIKPYWVVLDAWLFESPDCTGQVEMDGMAISSGEYVIKYANYHPKNIWDSDHQSSWASDGKCTPGGCWFGFRFRQPPALGCVRIEHAAGRGYHATSVSVEMLGPSGWEAMPDVTVELRPEAHEEL